MQIIFCGKTQDYKMFILIRTPVRFLFYAELSNSKVTWNDKYVRTIRTVFLKEKIALLDTKL